MHERRHAASAAGFTLIEILVTMIIIVVLIGILIPTVSHVRKKAQAARVQQQIVSIAGACERFFQEQHHYPGPIADQYIAANMKSVQPLAINGANGQPLRNADRITQSENFLLGLVGGLKWVDAGNAQWQLTFDPNMIGKGMVGMNPNKPQKFQPYLELPPAQISAGKYGDPSAPVNAGSGTGGADDSDIPEILDTFGDPMPILCLRAHIGAPGVVWDNTAGGAGQQQYDLTDMLPYTKNDPSGRSIGVGKSIRKSDYVNFAPQPTPGTWPHGLQTVDPQGTIHDKNNANYHYPYEAYGYLVSPSIPNTPRAKDTFILISAGIDRVYGTDDDICSFGPVKP